MAADEQGKRRRQWPATLLILIGVVLLAETAITVIWQEPVSALYVRSAQEDLSDQLAQLDRGARAKDSQTRKSSSRKPRQRVSRKAQLKLRARELRRSVPAGQAVGRLRIESLSLATAFVASTDPQALRLGPGHYATTSLPGEGGTVGLAGHRTTFGAPFRHIDGLVPDDKIKLAMPYGDFTYSVDDTRIVSPAAVRVLRRRKGRERLVLTACHPLYSNAKRIVVIARLWSGPGLKAPVEETGSQGPAENIDPCLRYDCPK